MSIKIITCSVVLILFFFHHSVFSQDADPIVILPDGPIRGHILSSVNGKPFYAFQEIPYATPPVGELRFKEPYIPQRWTGILDATKNKNICYQTPNGSKKTPNVTESEDCLYINVYTPLNPADTTATPLPVLVWIHGGGYMYGDGSYEAIGPQFFIDYDIVVVAMNYRLGPLGFLTTGDGVIPGNIGLKDQNLALQWVHDNIRLFNGDPTKVTIAGESAGGSSVGLQLISKKSAGLFRGVIMQSGTGITSSHQSFARDFAFQLASTLDPTFTSLDSNELLTFLQGHPAEHLTMTDIIPPIGKETGIGDHSGIVWAPVIEDADYDGAFITGPMQEDVKTGNINRVPALLGFTSQEFIISTGYDRENVLELAIPLDADLRKLINNNFNMTDADKLLAGRKLREIYTDGNFQDHLGALVKFMTDTSFANPTVREAELQSSYTDVYMYQFSYKGLLGGQPGNIEGIDDLEVGVAHSEDLLYLWCDSRNSDIYSFPVSDIITHTRLLKLWSNFVKYLNPTPEEDILLEKVIWPKVSPDNLVYLNIDRTLEIKTDPKEYKKAKAIIDQYAIPPLINY